MDIVRESLAVTFVFVLLWVALRLLKTRGVIRSRAGNSEPGLIESRGRLVLSPQHSLHWIRAGERQVLVGVHSSGFSVICEFLSGPSVNHPEAPRA